MNAFVLIYILLTPSGELSVRASSELMIGADLCLTRKAELEASLEVQKSKGQNGGFTAYCVDSKLVPGVKA